MQNLRRIIDHILKFSKPNNIRIRPDVRFVSPLELVSPTLTKVIKLSAGSGIKMPDVSCAQ